MTGQVNWLEWGEEPFRRAQAEGKPVLLSIVVEWDSWCRLMERETYGERRVAEIIQRDYVPVRVDADRRPDVSDRYAVGGWPSTVFLTPEGDLLWGTAALDSTQMQQILIQLREGFTTQRGKLAEAIHQRDALVARAREGWYGGRVEPIEEIIARTVRGIVRTYDPLSGGFNREPKFPYISSLRLLIQVFQQRRDEELRTILRKTLDAMGEHGLWDREGGGFHRVCMGAGWSGVRREKLTVDNAGHLRLYLEAGEVLGEPCYTERARETAEWLVRVMYDAESCTFGVSQAADDPALIDRTPIAEVNASAASAFFRAAAMLSEERYLTAARRALEGILTESRDPKLGIARYRDGTPRGFGLLRDQACVARALIDAYEVVTDPRYLAEAERLLEMIWRDYWDESEQGLLDRKPGFEEWGELRQRRKNVDENAVACEVALRMAALTKNAVWRTKVERTLGGFPDYREDYGHTTASLAVAVERLLHPPMRGRA